MKLSQFTAVVNDYPKPDHLLYHTLSRALIEVDKAGGMCYKLYQQIPPPICSLWLSSRSLRRKGLWLRNQLTRGNVISDT